MKITFLNEHRTAFQENYNEGDSQVLGSYEVKELLINETWQEPTTVKATFTAPTTWVQNNLLPGKNPTLMAAPYRRARYFTVRKESGKRATLLIEELEFESDGDGNSMVTMIGMDPRIWTQRISSALYSIDETWTGYKSDLMVALSERLSTKQIPGMMPWQRVPITPLSKDWWPTTPEARMGFVNPGQADDRVPVSITIPDPLPIQDSLEELHSQWSDVELYPIEIPSPDGSQAPWWRWATRQRVHSDFLFSEKNGTLKINKIKSSNAVTEVMAYNSQNKKEYAFANGTQLNPTNLSLVGPWMGLKAEGFSTPEGISTATYLKSRAMTGNYNNRRLSFDTTINFTESGIEATPGMTVFMRIDNSIVSVPLGEITSHYSAEKGWSTTSAVFIETDNIDLYDPTPIVEDSSDIQIVVNGSSFKIPTNYAYESEYSWSIAVDGEHVGSFSGISDDDSDGIYLNLGSAGEHLITISPLDGLYSDGWATAFSFWTGYTGANAPENKAKLLRVLSDRDAGHFAYSSSYGFRQNQFFECVNLTVTVEEDKGSFATGSVYYGSRESQYEGCISLRKAPDEHESAGTDFLRRRQYARCTSLTKPAVEARNWSTGSGADVENLLFSTGEGWREEQYADCTNLEEAATEVFDDGITEVGNNFRQRQYYNCVNLRTASPEAMTNNVDTILTNFRAGQYENCTSLLESPDEVMPSSLETHYRGSRDRQYMNCWSLTKAGKEASVSHTGDEGFGTTRVSQYENCISLVEAPDEVEGDSRERQYAGCGSLKKAAVENSEPSSRKQQYLNCYSLEEAAEEVAPPSMSWDYRMEQYRGCGSLTKAGKEAFPQDGVEIVSERFRAYQYADCYSLVEASDEAFADAVKEILPDFRNSQYYNCPNLKKAGAEATSSALTSLPDYYRLYQYNWCTSLDDPAVEIESPLIVEVGDGYRNNQYSYTGCKNAEGKLSEVLMPDCVSFGSHFRNEQFMGSKMVHALTEKLTTKTIEAMGEYNRDSQYRYCEDLISASPEPETNFRIDYNEDVETGEIIEAPRVPWYYREWQYADCVKLNQRGVNLLEIQSRASEHTQIRQFGWRTGQYFNTLNFDSPTARVNFIDGFPAVSQRGPEELFTTINVPSGFYSPSPDLIPDPTPNTDETPGETNGEPNQ